VQNKVSIKLGLRHFFLPRNNHWFRRGALVFAFVLFDYFATLAFCRLPYQEANIHARMFMENLGIPLGLTLFVLIANLPIYVTLCLDSHLVKLPQSATIIEVGVDVVFAWFIAGLHFSGGTSWFWFAPDLTRQALGTLLYLVAALLFVKPYKPRYDS
jgi:hypothetical protein